MTYIEWPNKRAIGASYCMDQTPHAEVLGGLAVQLRRRKNATGTITAPVPQNEHLTGRPLEHSLVQQLAAWAEKGVRVAASELGVDLASLDIELTEFAFHPVDSRLTVYSEAAASVFRSAWDAWQRFYDRDRRKD